MGRLTSLLHGKAAQHAITACCGASFLLFGYGEVDMAVATLTEDQGVMSGLLTGPAFTAQFPEIDTTDDGHGSAKLQGTVVAIYEVSRAPAAPTMSSESTGTDDRSAASSARCSPSSPASTWAADARLCSGALCSLSAPCCRRRAMGSRSLLWGVSSQDSGTASTRPRCPCGTRRRPRPSRAAKLWA